MPGPTKVFESSQAIVFDDFLPEDEYERLYEYTCTCDYKHINTDGTVSRVWRPRDGFPLRGTRNLFYQGEETDTERKKPDWVYPTGTGLDPFAKRLKTLAPEVQPLIGAHPADWQQFTVTSWIYPAGTGLSLHDDGGKYSGAYVYFLNPHWNIHWGGLLMLLAQGTTEKIQQYREEDGAQRFVRKKWSDESEESMLVWDPGFANCILPKCNRLVLIANDAQHLVTTVSPSAGDHMRRSLAGFFGKKD
jgi:hypothetical protein